MMTQRVSSAALMLLLLQTTAWTGVQSFCYLDVIPLEPEDFDSDDVSILDCIDPVTNETIPHDTYLLTPDCYNCSCYLRELQCCGYGHAAGVFYMEGKKLVKHENCSFHFEDE